MYLNNCIDDEIRLFSDNLVSNSCSLFYEVYDTFSGKVYALIYMDI